MLGWSRVFWIVLLLAACQSGVERKPLGKADSFGSCQKDDGTTLCGGQSEGSCWCDERCAEVGDCCEDRPLICGCGPAGCAAREVEVLFTEPYCDECSAADKAILLERSPITLALLAAIDGATASIDIAQFTFSNGAIEAALLRARDRGVVVRMAVNSAQENPSSVAFRLREAGIDVRFVAGKEQQGGFAGLQHAKFMIVDAELLFTGSNNWSSTGLSINEENTMRVRAPETDELLVGFACHFEAMWNGQIDAVDDCSSENVTFTPGMAARMMIRDSIRAAESTIDVLMHHLTFTDLVKELAKAQERGVRVRLIVNQADRDEHGGSQFQRLLAAGGEIRFKRNNDDAFQLMHHKLVVIDGRVLINGSGNWSGSAFFNNYENYVRYFEPQVVQRFEDLYERLWDWSLSAASLDAGLTAAQQHASDSDAFLGNLHAHIDARDGDRLLDDGKAQRQSPDGTLEDVDIGTSVSAAARFAFEYARDAADLDFLALSPHCSDEDTTDTPDFPNLSEAGYESLLATADAVNHGASGEFVALASMEWSTNSLGNHVGILGTRALAKVERGRFDHLYDGFLRDRRALGERPLLMLNHPRTFRESEDFLTGAWDQIFGVNLLDVPKAAERSKKFNDYGLDDYSPLRELLPSWIAGDALPDETAVAASLDAVRRASEPYARLMEVTMARGTEFGDETARNPSLSEDETGTVSRRTKVHDDFDYYLLHGFRIAPVATHDNHFANWGTGHTSRTGVLARHLGRKELLDALHRRAVFASEDENLELRFYVDDRVTMGKVTQTASRRVKASVHLEDPDYAGSYEVHVFRGRVGGAQVSQIAATTLPSAGWAELEVELEGDDGENFLYVEVLETGANRMAWSAPIWIEML